MRFLREGPAAKWSVLGLLLLAGCSGSEPDCNSADSRAAVIKSVSDDSNNALVEYAVKNSDALTTKVKTSAEADKSAILDQAKRSAVYRLSDTITTDSKSKDGRAATCSGTLFVTVEGVITQKQVEFQVERTTDGKSSVSVSPFKFEPAKD
jgi:hypothetical protein